LKGSNADLEAKLHFFFLFFLYLSHQVNTFTMTLNYSLLLLFSFIVDIRFVNPSCAYDVQEINRIHVFVACIQTPHIYNRGIRENRTVGDVVSFWSGLKSGVHAFEVALKVEASFQNWQVQKKRNKKGNLTSNIVNVLTWWTGHNTTH
jgi:hypothetical protein